MSSVSIPLGCRAGVSVLVLPAALIVLFLSGCEGISNIFNPSDDVNHEELKRRLVPNDYPTIQAAINAADVGDTVLVSPGTYQETISFGGKNIVVGSLFCTTNDTSYIRQTVINANWQGSVVCFDNLEDSTAELCGFTLIHGSGTYHSQASHPSHWGGGIYCITAEPTLHHLLIAHNEVDGRGGGIYIHTSKALKAHDIVLTNNRAESIGGGIYLQTDMYPPYPQFSNIAIMQCEAYAGGGLSITGMSRLIADHLEITANMANTGGGLHIESAILYGAYLVLSQNTANWSGGGINVNGGTLEIAHGTISGNSAGLTGGGAALTMGGHLEMVGIDVFQNQAGSNGGGISLASGLLMVDSSAIHDNHAVGGSGGAIHGYDMQISRTSLFNNTAANDGGAIFCQGDLTLENVLIGNNQAGLWGGGLFTKHHVTITNSTIAGNQAWIGGAGVIQASEDFIEADLANTISWHNNPPEFFLNIVGGFVGISAQINFCDIENGEDGFAHSGTYSPSIQWGEGNLDQAPLFTDQTSGDYHLSPTSPCIDAGNPTYEFNDKDGTRNDMGAYGGPHPLE
ncbi:MAG: hypothetical protein JSW54_02685 [Fidelibacterota bacterium]|nr:MAG: hypothetical protein JSW54_02685 [Candidatus Neomarinimicrobiota bacterium]